MKYLKDIASSLSWISLWLFCLVVNTCGSKDINIQKINDAVMHDMKNKIDQK